MNRNAESHFSQVPQLLDVRRSTMDIPFTHKTSFDIGSIIPFYAEEVLAGDTFRITTNKVVRLQTLLNPIMDNIYLDTYYFFIPFRLVWDHWKNLFGENTESAWIPEVEYTTPQMDFAEADGATRGAELGTLPDYFGVPLGKNLTWSALYMRAYHLVWSEFFRDQNLQDPLNIYKGDATRTIPNSAVELDVADTYLDERYPWPRKANRFHDYFSSALPSPQRGEAVNIPFTSPPGYYGTFPVYSLDAIVPDYQSANPDPLGQNTRTGMIGSIGYGTNSMNSLPVGLRGQAAASSAGSTANLNMFAHSSNTFSTYDFTPSNLWAQLTEVGINVEQLRQGLMIQHMLEVDALGGGRMRELLRSHFGVVSPDARLQVPEYLGGNRIALTVHEVVNQSQGESAFLGNLGAMSHTSDVHADFVHSFVEPGICLGLAVARYDNSFAQGLPRKFSRSGRYSYYWPALAGLGNQAILNKELYAQGTDADDEVFGYSEAWAEYRYGTPSLITSEMRPGVSGSLASWHLSDYYESQPYLSDDWIKVSENIPDRVLASSHENNKQIFADFYVQNVATRVMPLYSVPGMFKYF